MPAKPGGAVSGTFPSLKLGRAVHYSSSLERDFLFFVEFDRQVVSYVEQPLAIIGTLLDGTTHEYTPDFLVQCGSTRELVECKPVHELEHPHTQQQCWLGQGWADVNGCVFRLVTDTELRQGHKLANLKLLWRYSRWSVTADQTDGCLNRLDTREQLTVTQLAVLVQASHSYEVVPVIYHLLFHHRLSTDLSQPLTGDSLVWKVS
ncbi:MAG: TnsA endonuclease N-terminal domain-containing protein [Aggregatilineales bacterium]